MSTWFYSWMTSKFMVKMNPRSVLSLISVQSSANIRMEFELKSCSVLVLKRGKLICKDGLVIPSEKFRKDIEEMGYK